VFAKLGIFGNFLTIVFFTFQAEVPSGPDFNQDSTIVCTNYLYIAYYGFRLPIGAYTPSYLIQQVCVLVQNLLTAVVFAFEQLKLSKVVLTFMIYCGICNCSSNLA